MMATNSTLNKCTKAKELKVSPLLQNDSFENKNPTAMNIENWFHRHDDDAGTGYQFPLQQVDPIHTSAPDNTIYAQYVELFQSGAYQIFDQRTGLLQQPLLENIWNANAVLIPCTPQHSSDSTPSSAFTNQAPVRCYSSPYGPLPPDTGINQTSIRNYPSPSNLCPEETCINQDPESIQTPEIREGEKMTNNEERSR
jgi:hypothetical protein